MVHWLIEIFSDHPDIWATVHCAGLIVVPESVQQPLRYYRENVSKTIDLIDHLVRNRCRRVLFSSTAALYGSRADFAADEKSPIEPASPYARTKAVGRGGSGRLRGGRPSPCDFAAVLQSDRRRSSDAYRSADSPSQSRTRQDDRSLGEGRGLLDHRHRLADPGRHGRAATTYMYGIWLGPTSRRWCASTMSWRAVSTATRSSTWALARARPCVNYSPRSPLRPAWRCRGAKQPLDSATPPGHTPAAAVLPTCSAGRPSTALRTVSGTPSSGAALTTRTSPPTSALCGPPPPTNEQTALRSCLKEVCST